MRQIDFKVGIGVCCISIIIFIVEIGIYFILGISAQAASGTVIQLFFDILFFIIIVTLVVSVLSLIFGLLYKFFKLNINSQQLIVLSVIIGGLIFFVL